MDCNQINRAVQQVQRFLREDHGPTAAEYAVCLSLIVLASMAAISALGTKVSNVMSYVAANM